MLYLNPFRAKMSREITHRLNKAVATPGARTVHKMTGSSRGPEGSEGEPWPLAQPQPAIFNTTRRFFLSPEHLNCTCATFSLPSLIAEVKNIVILHVSCHLNVRDNLAKLDLSCLPPRHFRDGVMSPARSSAGPSPQLEKK